MNEVQGAGHNRKTVEPVSKTQNSYTEQLSGEQAISTARTAVCLAPFRAANSQANSEQLDKALHRQYN